MKHFLPLFGLLLVCSGTFAQTFPGSGGLVPDDGSVNDYPATVSGLSPATIDTVNFGLETVCVNITHTWNSDLDVRLVAPDGTEIILFSGVGGSDDDFTNTCLNSNASTSILSGTAPFTGTFKPQGQMGYVNNGQNGNGTWKLRITDTYPADQGNLLSWSITFGNNPATYSAFTSSNLPLVIINTGNQFIPDDPKIMADMGIIYNGPGIRNYMTDPHNNYSGKIGIETRGSSSQGFPKKSYGIELWDVNGNSIDSSLIGMPKESDWILSANYSDKSLLNNTLAYHLFTQTGHYATRHQHVELVIDSIYRGVYILMEKIKRDNDRVDIAKLQPTDIAGDQLTGGYIIKIDKGTGSGGSGWNSNYAPLGSTNGQQIFFQYEYPNEIDIVPQQQAYIQAYVDSFETALNGPNFASLTAGYSKYIDVTSFIDYLLLNEISRNVDGYRLSTYLFKDKLSNGGKLFIGPPWDYDIAWANANYCRGDDATGWAYRFNYDCSGDYWQIPFWWERLLQDPVFANHLRCRWETLKTTEYSIATLHAYCDSMAIYLNEGQQRNFTEWPILGQYVWPNPSPIPSTFQGEIDELKNWISARWAWMDANMPGSLAGCDLAVQSGNAAADFVSVFPNPFHDQLTLQFKLETASDVTIVMSDITGRQISFVREKMNAGGQDYKLPVENISPGIYLLSVSAEGRTFTKKIVRQ
ncbi:MAG: Spore coat protein CotH [Bacteroidetes bacterium]|nr:MAG: Spore coat protein CotH [Bacteroidota bacterium]